MAWAGNVTPGEITPRPNGLSRQVWRLGKPLIVHDPQLLHPTARLAGAQSVIALPLRGEPVNLGVLFLSYWEPRSFSEREVELLALFTNQVALAIKRVRLAAETRHHAEQLAVPNRIVSALNQPTRLDELLEVIHREVTGALPCDAFFIALYDPTANELDYRIQIDEDLRLPP